MNIMPGAAWRPVRNFSVGGVNRPPKGMVLHTAVGSFEGTISWQNNASSSVSSYFVVAKDGRIAQCVDLDNRAWTQSAGNTDWIGVECEGNQEALTQPQLQAVACIYAWLVGMYKLPLATTEDPINGHGLGWHGMGGTNWGGHFQCPGSPIVNQRNEILNVVSSLLGKPAIPAPPTPGPSALAVLYQIAKGLGKTFTNGPILVMGSRGQAVKDLQFALVAGTGQKITVDGSFGRQTDLALRNVQRFFHVPIDGIVGAKTRGIIAELLKVKFP